MPVQGDMIDGKYRLLEPLGTGGFASVWRAHDPNVLRDVAIKLLHPDLAADQDQRERFKREAQLAADFAGRSDNIADVYEFGIDEATGMPYICSPLIEGKTIKDRLIAEPPHLLSPDEARRVLRDMRSALEVVHQKGAHRDISPGNIMLTRDRAVLLDFGVARRLSEESDLTPHGQVLGTAAYVAPERWTNPESDDRRADLYSLGAVLWRALTNELPYGAKRDEILGRVRARQRTKSDFGSAPPELVALIERLVEPAPVRRATLTDIWQTLSVLDRGHGEPVDPPPEPRQRATPERVRVDEFARIRTDAARYVKARHRLALAAVVFVAVATVAHLLT